MTILKEAKPLPPTVKIVNPDGTPTRDFHAWLTRQYDHLTTPGSPSDFTPTEATIAAAGPPGRAITQVSVRNAVVPVTWSITENPGALSVEILSIGGQAAATLSTTANPAGAVGARFLTLSAVDAEGKRFTGTIKITLT